MPVLSKEKHKLLDEQLAMRINKILKLFSPRPLEHDREGLTKARARWKDPATLCATKGTTTELYIAIEDFKTILNEIKKLN